jgi:heme exporter protein A
VTPPAVDLSAIARRFGRRWVLRGVSLTVGQGEVVALLGRNGSGKTTLLRIVATLLRPTRGHGDVLGHDLVRDADAVRGRVGLLGHGNPVYPDLTAAENLRFTLRMAGRPPEPAAIDAALRAVGLASERDARARDFSAGMGRRLALARTRLLEPELLLLDEPYSSLDPLGAELVTSLIAETRRRNGSAILVTHDIARARDVADRIVSLEGGRIVPWTPAESPAAGVASDGGFVDAPSPARSER